MSEPLPPQRSAAPIAPGKPASFLQNLVDLYFSPREAFARIVPDPRWLLPAVGYGDAQVRDLEETIRRVPCDLVIVATPVDLTRIVRIDKPMLRARYSLAETTRPDLTEHLRERMKLWPST